MRFSISFPPQIDRASPEPYRKTIELAQAAERAGFHSLALGQHHLMAGVAPRAIERAARLGDAWLCDPVQTLPEVKRLSAEYRAACAREKLSPVEIARERFLWGSSDEVLSEMESYRPLEATEFGVSFSGA